MNPSTTVFATRSRLEMPARTAGSKNRCMCLSWLYGNRRLEINAYATLLLFGPLNGFEQTLQQIVLRQLIAFRLEIEQNAMTQNRPSHLRDILEADVVALVHQRASLSGQY